MKTDWLRQAQVADHLESLRGFWTSTGPERAYWRGRLRYSIQIERQHDGVMRAQLIKAVQRHRTDGSPTNL
jgi:hypothetical protein